MNLKRGDKVICKKTLTMVYTYTGKSEDIFIAGEEYKINGVLDSTITVELKGETGFGSFLKDQLDKEIKLTDEEKRTWRVFSDYFYTPQSLRKAKLEKINEK